MSSKNAQKLGIGKVSVLRYNYLDKLLCTIKDTYEIDKTGIHRIKIKDIKERATHGNSGHPTKHHSGAAKISF